jgi:hypothetical protein
MFFILHGWLPFPDWMPGGASICCAKAAAALLSPLG